MLYGAGKRGKAYFKQLKCREDYEITLWVDKDYAKYVEKGYEVYAPKDIKNITYDVILIAVYDFNIVQSIIDELTAMGINKDKIIW